MSTETPTPAGRMFASRIAMPEAPAPDLRRALIGTAALRIDAAMDNLRRAFILEADDEGEFTQAIIDTQDNVRDAMAGCAALIIGMAERARKT